MARTSLLRQAIAEAIVELASPIEVRAPGYHGPGEISDQAVICVLDIAQGGLPARDRQFGTESFAAAAAHNEVVFQAEQDEEWFLRSWQITWDNATGTDAVVSDWRLSIENDLGTIGVRLVSGKVANIGAGDSLVICPFNFDLNQANGGATWGMEQVNAFQSFRFAPGDVLRFAATSSQDLGVDINWVVDVGPRGVYISP